MVKFVAIFDWIGYREERIIQPLEAIIVLCYSSQHLLPIKLFLPSLVSTGATGCLFFPLLFPGLEFFPFACLSEKLKDKDYTLHLISPKNRTS